MSKTSINLWKLVANFDKLLILSKKPVILSKKVVWRTFSNLRSFWLGIRRLWEVWRTKKLRITSLSKFEHFSPTFWQILSVTKVEQICPNFSNLPKISQWQVCFPKLSSNSARNLSSSPRNLFLSPFSDFGKFLAKFSTFLKLFFYERNFWKFWRKKSTLRSFWLVWRSLTANKVDFEKFGEVWEVSS